MAITEWMPDRSSTPVDALPSASASLKGTIYYLTTDNKYYVVNAAGNAWEDIAISDAVPNHDHTGDAGDGGVIGTTAATASRLALRSSEGVVAAQAVDVATTASDLSATHTPGRMRWNDTDGTIEVDTAYTDVTYQLGQETSIKVSNDSGANILNGDVVRISGSSGQRIRVTKAQANSAANLDGTIGVATMNINDGSSGIVTTRGLVRGLDTNSYTAGDNIWVSPTTAGGWTSTEPSAPNFRCRVGTIAVKNNGNGSIYVSPDNQVELDEHTQQTYTAHAPVNVGADYLHGIESMGAFSFNDSTHVFTIAADTNTYWYKGARYSTANAITCDLDSYVTLADNTIYFFYFDGSAGTLKAKATAWDILTEVPVAIVWWNGSAGAIQNEKHTFRRDLEWHKNAHLTIGTRYYNGLDLTYPNAANDALLQIETGYIADEDIFQEIPQSTTCRYAYQVSSGVYTWANGTLPYTGTSGQPQWLDTDDYTLKNVGVNEYAAYWYYATLDQDRPIYIIPTQAAAAYGTLNAARAETPPALAGLNLVPEIKLLYKVIFRGNGEFQEYVDYRTASSLPSGFIATAPLIDHDHTGDAGDGGTLSGSFVKATTNDGSTDCITAKDSDGVEVFAVDSNGDIEITGAAPSYKIYTNSDSGSTNPVLKTYRASASGGATPTTVVMGGVLGFGHTGVGYTGAKCGFYLVASELWSATNNGCEIRFYTTPKASTTSAEVVRITDAGTIQALYNLARNAPVSVTGSTHTVAATNNWIIVNYAGTCTVTLPAASSFTGREIMIKTITANEVISNASNVVPLVGGSAGTAILAATAGKWATLVSDGSNWVIMQGN